MDDAEFEAALAKEFAKPWWPWGDDDEEELDVVNGARRSTGGTFWSLPERRFRTDGRRPIRRDDRYDALSEQVAKLVAWTDSGSVESAFHLIRKVRSILDELEYEVVAIARGHHWSWQAIGDALGVGRSAAHRRFARAEVVRRSRRPLDET